MKPVESPIIIQGGMGAGVSGWPLAQAVARTGHLGVVSGTALDVILPRRLQVGDVGGHIRRALDHFPVPGVAKRIIDRYFVPGGKAEGFVVLQETAEAYSLLVVYDGLPNGAPRAVRR